MSTRITPPPFPERYSRPRRKSYIESTRQRYLILTIVGLTGPIWILWMRHALPVTNLLTFYYSFYMLFCGFASLQVYRRLSDVPWLISQSLVVAQRELVRINKFHIRFRVMSWIAGGPLILLLFHEIYIFGDSYMFGCACFGGIIGFIAGVTIEVKNTRQLKAAIREIEADLADEGE